MKSLLEPEPLAFPIDMYDMPFVATVHGTGLDELAAMFGKSTGIQDPGDPGPMERWAFQYPCGLRIIYVLDLFHRRTTMISDTPEIAHVARHLKFDSSRIEFISEGGLQAQIEYELRYHPERKAEFDSRCVAQVWRQGDDGNKFPVGELTSVRDAKCLIAEFESCEHSNVTGTPFDDVADLSISQAGLRNQCCVPLCCPPT